MKSIKSIAALALVAALGLFSAVPAFAGTPYVGISSFFNHASPDLGPVNEAAAHMQNLGLKTSIYSDQNSTSANVFVGYQFNQYLAIQASTMDLGNATVALNYATPPNPEFNISGKTQDKVTVNGYGVSLIGGVPLAGGTVVPYVEVGAASLHVSSKFTYFASFNNTIESQSRNYSHDQTNTFYGAGLQVNFMPHAAVRLGFKDFGSVGNNDTGKAKMTSTVLSLLYKF